MPTVAALEDSKICWIHFSNVFLIQGVLKLKHKVMEDDVRPIDPTCSCMVGHYFKSIYSSI